jgi:hypothetical protein
LADVSVDDGLLDDVSVGVTGVGESVHLCHCRLFVEVHLAVDLVVVSCHLSCNHPLHFSLLVLRELEVWIILQLGHVFHGLLDRLLLVDECLILLLELVALALVTHLVVEELGVCYQVLRDLLHLCLILND